MENVLRQSVGAPPLQKYEKGPPGPAQAELEYLAATIRTDDGTSELLMKRSAKMAATHPLWADELGSKIKLDEKTRATLEVLASKRRRETADWFISHGWVDDATRVYYPWKTYPVDALEVKEAIDEERLAEASLFVHGYTDRTLHSSNPNPAAVKEILEKVQSDAKYIERANAMLAAMSAQRAK